MVKLFIKPEFRYGFNHGYIVVNDVYNEVTEKKDIQEYYNGGLSSSHEASFTKDINHAVFYATEKEARNHCRLCNNNIAGYPGVFCHVEKAHIEAVI